MLSVSVFFQLPLPSGRLRMAVEVVQNPFLVQWNLKEKPLAVNLLKIKNFIKHTHTGRWQRNYKNEVGMEPMFIDTMKEDRTVNVCRVYNLTKPKRIRRLREKMKGCVHQVNRTPGWPKQEGGKWRNKKKTFYNDLRYDKRDNGLHYLRWIKTYTFGSVPQCNTFGLMTSWKPSSKYR